MESTRTRRKNSTLRLSDNPYASPLCAPGLREAWQAGYDGKSIDVGDDKRMRVAYARGNRNAAGME